MNTRTKDRELVGMRRELVALQRRRFEAYLGEQRGLSASDQARVRRRYDQLRTDGVEHEAVMRVLGDQVRAMSNSGARAMSAIERDARRGVNPLAAGAEALGMKRDPGAPRSQVHRLAAKFHDGPDDYGDDLPAELEDFGASDQGRFERVLKRVIDAWRKQGMSDQEMEAELRRKLNLPQTDLNTPPMEGRGPARV